MVCGSVLCERLQPGTGLGGGSDIRSLPSLGEGVRHKDMWLMQYSGHFSIVVLILGTVIWGYGDLIIL
jgi:hypothetical protein